MPCDGCLIITNFNNNPLRGTNTKEEAIMNKREIKKQIRAAAKKAGIRVRRWQVNNAADIIIMCGGVNEAKEKLDQFAATREYIGTKIVEAAPALRIDDGDGNVRIELLRDHPITLPTDTVDMGYKVIYPDGHESWNPYDVFDVAYRPTDGMNFGLALEAAKMGKRIARKGWNGKGQYVELGRRLIYATHDGYSVEAQHEDIGSQALVFVGARGRQVGWLASQADMLADDWYIVDEEV